MVLNHRHASDVVHQERQLQLANGSIAELHKELDDSQRRMRELEDQIQSDDRVERLEDSLKNTQDRADELEFQLSKLRQVGMTCTAGQFRLNFQSDANHVKV